MDRIYKQLTPEEVNSVLTEFKRIQDEDKSLEQQKAQAAKRTTPSPASA